MPSTSTLLLAEDDPILADALTAELGQAGFAVEHAPNGAVAEFLLMKQNFDVAILDLGLPLVDGLTVLRRVRPQVVPLQPAPEVEADGAAPSLRPPRKRT